MVEVGTGQKMIACETVEDSCPKGCGGRAVAVMVIG